MLRVWLACAAALVAAGCSRAEQALPAVRPASASTGGLFAFECTVAGQADVCTVSTGGGTERRLTDHPAEDLYPRWLRDGTGLVFSSERSGHWQLWQMDPEGGSLHQLRDTPAREWQADPQPGWRSGAVPATLAFLSDAGGQEALRLTGTGQAGRALLAHGPRVVLGNPHWSPDGTRLVLSSNRGRLGHHVYLVEAGSGEERRLSPLASGACEPRFHPDGRRVAWVRRSHLTRERSEIVEHDLASGRERVLVAWPALNYDPTWSPDGTELAFVSDLAGSGQSIYRLRLSDGQAWRVTFSYPARHPDYRPGPVR